MEERREIISFPRNMRIRVFMHAIGSVSHHWHRSLELLFLVDVKLSHAMEQLTSTEDTVERVAAGNGFTEPHTFIRASKQKFGETPSVYRRQAQRRGPESNMAAGLNYLTLESSNYLTVLEKYTRGSGFNSPRPAAWATGSSPVATDISSPAAGAAYR